VSTDLRLTGLAGVLRVDVPGRYRTAGTRSYLSDGRVVTWCPDPAVAHRCWAVDAEIAAQAVPAALARRTGLRDPDLFWRRWTAAEVACKLLDRPMICWLSRHGLSPEPIRAAGLALRTEVWNGLVVTIGSFAPGLPGEVSRPRGGA